MSEQRILELMANTDTNQMHDGPLMDNFDVSTLNALSDCATSC